MRTCLEPQMKLILVVSLGGGSVSTGASASESWGTARVSAGTFKLSAGAFKLSTGACRVSACAFRESAVAALGLSAGLFAVLSAGLSAGSPVFWPCAGGVGGRLGSVRAASSAALAAAAAAASAALRRYSITGSPAMSERRFWASFSHSSGMSHFRMPRRSSRSPPRYRVSRLSFSSLMDMMAGSRVMRICDRLSVYWNLPASAKTFRVVSMSST